MTPPCGVPCVVHGLIAPFQMAADLLQRLMRRAVGTKPIGAIFKVGFKDRLQDEQRRHLHDTVPHGRYPQRSHLPVGFRDVHAAHWLRPVGLAAQRFPDLSQEPAHARVPRFDLVNRHAVHAGCSVVGSHPPPGLFQCVPPIDPVVQNIKPELRLLLRLLMQLLSQQREFLRHPRVAFRSAVYRLVRSGAVQAALLSSYFRASPARPLGSIRITGLPCYCGPLRLPARAARGYLFPLAAASSCGSAPGPGLPGSSADLSLRAAPSHPGKSGDCFYPLLHRRSQASSLSGGLATSIH